MVEADLASHALGGLHVEIAEGVDVQTLDRFRMFLGDLLDFGAAVRGGEDIEVPRCAVHGYRHVVLMQDVLRLGDEHTVDLMAVDGHREDGFGQQYRFVTVVGDLDAARLAAMADLDLGLDHARVSDGIGRFGDLVGVLGENGPRRGNMLFLQQFSCLVFIKIHVRRLTFL